MPEQHSPYGGSTAGRTLNCPGWRQLVDTLPVSDSSSMYADRGTLLHNAMEAIYDGDLEAPEEVIGTTYKDQVLTEELFNEKIVPAIAAVEEIFAAYGIEEFACEERVGFSDDSWGTGDLIGAGSAWSLILDYKFGDGVMVSPVENAQFLFYGSAAYHTVATADLFDDVEKVVFAVVQPSSHAENDYEVWETTTKRLKDFRKPWLAAVDAAKQVDADTCAGDWCKFCPAAAICPQKTGSAQRALLMDPKDLKTLGTSLKLVAEMEAWCNDVKETAHAQMENGATLKGWKLVMKRATRSWLDADKMASILARKLGGMKNVVVTKPISPAQAEKLAKAQKVSLDLQKYVVSKSSGTTLAKSSDKRPEVLSGNAAQAALASLN